MGIFSLHFSCSAACGIFSDQRLNLGLLHGQVKFFTTEPPGKPKRWYLNADGKEPAEREGADPVQRRGTTDGAVSLRRETDPKGICNRNLSRSYWDSWS